MPPSAPPAKLKNDGAMRPIQLMPHQQRVAAAMAATGNAQVPGMLCIHSTGTGKTITAAACIKLLMERKRVTCAVVLTRKSAVDQFRREVVRCWPAAAEADLTVTTFEGYFPSDAEAPVLPRAPTLLIVDEAHNFCNPATASTKRLVQFSRDSRCQKRLLLTATPVLNSTADLNTLLAITKGIPPLSAAAFAKAAAADLEKLAARVVSVHVIDKSTAPEYPKLYSVDVGVRMSPSAFAAYNALKAKRDSFYLPLRQFSLSASRGACEKCAWLAKSMPEWVRRDEKVLVYTAFVDNGEAVLRSLFAKMGVNTLVIDGDTTSAERARIMSYFNAPPSARATRSSKAPPAPTYATEAKEGTLCGVGNEFFERVADGTFRRDGKPHTLTPAEREHFEGLGVPPAWARAKVCRPDGKLLYVAQDRKGKWQYRYSVSWNIDAEYEKVSRLKALTPAFWDRFKARVETDLRQRNWSETKVLALMASVMHACHLRPGGNEVEAEDDSKQHFGLTTLRRKHFEPRTGEIQFTGKAGVTNRCQLDASLASRIVEMAPQSGKRLDTRKRTADAPLFAVMGVNGDNGVAAPTAAKLRAYLRDATGRRLRPKDFRTFFANYTLIDTLRRHPPLEMRRAERQKVLRGAYQKVAAGLNNTPKVSERSYVFTGFTVAYLVRPALFSRLIREHESLSTGDMLIKMVEELTDRSDGKDWRDMLEFYREYGDSIPFEGTASVLLITDAGSESLDLKGVRHVVMMDPPWTAAQYDQVIGRAQRFRSHAALPKSKRDVTVHNLFLDGPKGEPLIERKIRETAERKRGEAERAIARLTQVSI